MHTGTNNIVNRSVFYHLRKLPGKWVSFAVVINLVLVLISIMLCVSNLELYNETSSDKAANVDS